MNSQVQLALFIREVNNFNYKIHQKIQKHRVQISLGSADKHLIILLYSSPWGSNFLWPVRTNSKQRWLIVSGWKHHMRKNDVTGVTARHDLRREILQNIYLHWPQHYTSAHLTSKVFFFPWLIFENIVFLSLKINFILANTLDHLVRVSSLKELEYRILCQSSFQDFSFSCYYRNTLYISQLTYKYTLTLNSSNTENQFPIWIKKVWK